MFAPSLQESGLCKWCAAEKSTPWLGSYSTWALQLNKETLSSKNKPNKQDILSCRTGNEKRKETGKKSGTKARMRHCFSAFTDKNPGLSTNSQICSEPNVSSSPEIRWIRKAMGCVAKKDLSQREFWSCLIYVCLWVTSRWICLAIYTSTPLCHCDSCVLICSYQPPKKMKMTDTIWYQTNMNVYCATAILRSWSLQMGRVFKKTIMNPWSSLRHQAQGGQVHIDGGRTGSSAGRRPTKLLGQIYINLPSVDERWYRWGMLGMYCGHRCLPNWCQDSVVNIASNLRCLGWSWTLQLSTFSRISQSAQIHVTWRQCLSTAPFKLGARQMLIARTIDSQTTPSKTNISCQLHVSQENHSMVLGCFMHGLLSPEFCLVSTLRPVFCCIGCFGGLRRIHACASQLERA